MDGDYKACRMMGKTYTDAEAIPLGLVDVPKVDAQARAALGAEHLVLLLRVEAVPRHAGLGLAVPLDLLTVGVLIGGERRFVTCQPGPDIFDLYYVFETAGDF